MPIVKVEIFGDKALVHVKAQGINPDAGYVLCGQLLFIPTRTECELSFLLDLDTGKSTNYDVSKFRQSFYVEQMRSIS